MPGKTHKKPVSEKQRRWAHAVVSGSISSTHDEWKVAREMVAGDPGGKLPEKKSTPTK